MANKKGGVPKPAQQPAPVLSLSKASDMNMMVLKRIDSQIEEVRAGSEMAKKGAAGPRQPRCPAPGAR